MPKFSIGEEAIRRLNEESVPQISKKKMDEVLDMLKAGKTLYFVAEKRLGISAEKLRYWIDSVKKYGSGAWEPNK